MQRTSKKSWLNFIEDNCNRRGLSLEESFRAAEERCRRRRRRRRRRITTTTTTTTTTGEEEKEQEQEAQEQEQEKARVAQKRANLSHCKYSENSVTKLRENW